MAATQPTPSSPVPPNPHAAPTSPILHSHAAPISPVPQHPNAAPTPRLAPTSQLRNLPTQPHRPQFRNHSPLLQNPNPTQLTTTFLDSTQPRAALHAPRLPVLYHGTSGRYPPSNRAEAQRQARTQHPSAPTPLAPPPTPITTIQIDIPEKEGQGGGYRTTKLTQHPTPTADSHHHSAPAYQSQAKLKLPIQYSSSTIEFPGQPYAHLPHNISMNCILQPNVCQFAILKSTPQILA